MTPPLLYILSASYSGSTLLTFLLARHPAIATIGELKASALGPIEEYDCSCGQKLTACAFWRQVGEAMRAQRPSFSLADFGTHLRDPHDALVNRLLGSELRPRPLELARDAALALHPRARARLRDLLAQNVSLASIVTSMQGGQWFLDGSKDAIRLKLLRRAGFPQVRAIYLVRDGRAAACSFMRHYQAPMSVAAHEWTSTQLACRRMVQSLPSDATVRLRYEDLCAAPDAEMGRLWRFLDLAAPDEPRRAELHILGNAMRLRDTGAIRLDERWRRDLTPADLQAFDRIAGRMNARLGYPPVTANATPPAHEPRVEETQVSSTQENRRSA